MSRIVWRLADSLAVAVVGFRVSYRPKLGVLNVLRLMIHSNLDKRGSENTYLDEVTVLGPQYRGSLTKPEKQIREVAGVELPNELLEISTE